MLDFVVLLENDAFGFLEKGEAEAEQHDNNEWESLTWVTIMPWPLWWNLLILLCWFKGILAPEKTKNTKVLESTKKNLAFQSWNNWNRVSTAQVIVLNVNEQNVPKVGSPFWENRQTT